MNNNLEVHPSGGSSSTWFLVALEIGNVGFSGGDRVGGNWSAQEKTSLGARERTNNKLNPHYGVNAGIRTQATRLVYPKMRRPNSL